jgi:hypothetical protein
VTPTRDDAGRFIGSATVGNDAKDIADLAAAGFMKYAGERE